MRVQRDRVVQRGLRFMCPRRRPQCGQHHTDAHLLPIVRPRDGGCRGGLRRRPGRDELRADGSRPRGEPARRRIVHVHRQLRYVHQRRVYLRARPGRGRQFNLAAAGALEVTADRHSALFLPHPSPLYIALQGPAGRRDGSKSLPALEDLVHPPCGRNCCSIPWDEYRRSCSGGAVLQPPHAYRVPTPDNEPDFIIINQPENQGELRNLMPIHVCQMQV